MCINTLLLHLAEYTVQYQYLASTDFLDAQTLIMRRGGALGVRISYAQL